MEGSETVTRGRMEILCSQDEKRKWKLKKNVFNVQVFLKRCLKTQGKKADQREKESASMEIYIALYIWEYILISWQSSTTL